ncbi:MAG: FG-GAP-like repeat-containing protein [Chitinophagales bacterium]
MIESNVTNKLIGSQLAVGDVNGDGYSDVVASYAGSSVELYYGSSAGLNTFPSWSVSNPDNSDFNETIEVSPDVNGDGYADIFISARSAEYSEYVNMEGAVFGYYGSPSGPSATENWKVWGNMIGYTPAESSSSYFGYGVKGTTDFNGDGFYDVIITAYKSDLDQLITCCESQDEGEIRIYFGSENGLEESYKLRLEGKIIGGQFGYILNSLGDINNDGFDDFLTGSQQLTANNIYFFYGHEINTELLENAALPVDQLESGFGNSFDCAGDINGDGYSDFMLTAPDYDASYENAGKLYIYYGSAEGIKTMPDFTFTGVHIPVIDAKPAGDVNGDGYSDILLITDEIDGPDKQINCYLGSELGLNMDTYTTHIIDTDYPARFVFAKGADFNNDGYSDVVIGNPYSYFDDNGNMYIYLGTAAGLSETAYAIITYEMDERFGLALTVSDANADGFTDIIVAAPTDFGAPSAEPKLLLFKGNSSGVDLSPSWIYIGPDYVDYGFQVENLGDVNGDGFGDIIAHSDIDNMDDYLADVFFGSITGFDATPDWTFNAENIDDQLTGVITPAGDFNNDGYADIFVPSETAKKIYIYFGSKDGFGELPDDFIESPTEISPESNYTFFYNKYSTMIKISGDNNADGYLEYAITNHYDDDATLLDDPYDQPVYLFGSKPFFRVSENQLIFQTNQANSQLGYSIADAGDVNGDGIDDMIVGAPFFDNGQLDEGKIFVFYGSNSELSLTPEWSFENNKAKANFGISVAAAGDVNGDGYGDIIAGASKLSHGQSQEGGAYIYYGSPTGLMGTPVSIESNQDKANLGVSVSSAGDINRDGYGDIIIGAEKYDNGLQDEGAVYVHYGSAAGINPLPNLILENNKKKSNFGHSVAQAGDVNGDGYSDIFVGADKLTTGQSLEGKVYIYKGSSGGLITTPIWSYESNQINANLGCSVSSAGDVNGDGFSDVLAGAYNFDSGQIDEGAAFIFYGSASGPSTFADWIGESGKTGAGFGFAVSGGGDFNSDGYSDVVIGAPFYDNGETNEGKLYTYFGSADGLEKNIGWTTESNTINKQLGYSINNRSDLNADGYSDILCGSILFSGPEISEGIAEIFYGNGLENKRNNIVLFNNDLSSPISSLNLAQTDFGFNYYRTDPEGLGESKAVWEIKTAGIPFSESIFNTIENSIEFTDEQNVYTMADDVDTYLFELVNKEGDINKIRVRQKYDLINSFDGRIYGPWRYYGSPTMQGPVPAPKIHLDDDAEVNKELTVQVYPNPAHDQVYIEIKYAEGNSSPFELYVFNINGVLIRSQHFEIANDHALINIDCSGMPSGTYIISYVSGNESLNKKFIKL